MQIIVRQESLTLRLDIHVKNRCSDLNTSEGISCHKVCGSNIYISFLALAKHIDTGMFKKTSYNAYYPDVVGFALNACDKNIAKDAIDVFNALASDDTVKSVDKLLVAPNCLQNKVLDMIDEQIAIAQSGGEGYIGVKINSLTDKKIIDRFIEASRAGVKIDLVVRGICCLIPGVEGETETSG